MNEERGNGRTTTLDAKRKAGGNPPDTAPDNDRHRRDPSKRSNAERGSGMDTFLKGGEQSLKVRSSDALAQTEREIKELKAAIGEFIHRQCDFKKSKALWGSSEETES
jgi:hypothetical protein